MKKARFSESQILAILKQQESGQTVVQIAREHAISEATFYIWKSKYSGMQVSQLTRLKELEEENRRLDLPTKAVHLGSSRCMQI